TFLLEERIQVEEDEIAPWDFILPRNAFERADEISKEARPILDVVASLASAVLDRAVLENLLVDDRVLFFAEGKRPAGAPVIGGGGGSVSIKIGGNNALQSVAARMDVLRLVDRSGLRQHHWLAKVAHWNVEAL